MLSNVALNEIQSSAFKNLTEEEEILEECLVNTKSIVENMTSGLAFRLSVNLGVQEPEAEHKSIPQDQKEGLLPDQEDTLV